MSFRSPLTFRKTLASNVHTWAPYTWKNIFMMLEQMFEKVCLALYIYRMKQVLVLNGQWLIWEKIGVNF